ncbi:MAG: heparinase II/III family protein, partial [Microthrixaceae bacterium]|nr:heparinase II/III family protein [Microthrixaceae bacterium]
YHDLESGLKERLRDWLDREGRREYEALAKHEVYQAGVYGWNIAGDQFHNIAAAGFALYGEVPKVAPWLRYVTERARVVTQALGADGVSPEGICYGGFFTDTYVKTLDLVHRLMGVDLFAGNAYLQQMAWFFAFSSLPRRRLQQHDSLLCLGDGHPYHWVGPASYLHKAAACYRDPLAQWTAALYRAAGASTKPSSLCSLLWYDPAVPDTRPPTLPLAHHFTDKDVVTMRSDWEGDETVLVFKCGPHAGHHALKHYPQCIGGGHMAADAGTILFYSHGERMISDGGYARKYTSYRNTVLINGVGQTGECDGSSDWFECSQLRAEKRGPSILHVSLRRDRDYVLADVAPAYGAEARLARFLRHVLYLRPDTVVIVDELVATAPVTCELWFHAHNAPHGKAEHPFVAAGPGVWESASPQGRCRVSALLPVPVVAEPGLQRVLGIGAHVDRDMDVLRLRNAEPVASALFITVIEALGPAEARPVPMLQARSPGLALRLHQSDATWSCILSPGQAQPATPIVSGCRRRRAQRP